jgi:hypothetical protein
VIGVFGASIPAFVAAQSNERVSRESYFRDKRIELYSDLALASQRATEAGPIRPEAIVPVDAARAKVQLVGSQEAARKANQIVFLLIQASIEESSAAPSAPYSPARSNAEDATKEFTLIARDDLGADR